MSNSKNIATLTADGESSIFQIDRPLSKGYADTEYSTFLEIYGDLGGGTLSLQKEALDGTFRELEVETNDIATKFPSSGKMLVKALNYKSNEDFKFVLTGSTSPSITINGYNIKLVT